MGLSVLNAPAAAGGVTQKVQEFTSTGSFVTPSNVTAVEVFLVGGGGGGGWVSNNAGNTFIASAGAAGGEVIRQLIPVTAGTTYTVTIGAGGAGATSLVNGSTGGTTSFGSLIYAYGGNGGGSIQQNINATYPIRGGGAAGPTGASGGGAGAGAGAGGPSLAFPGYGNSASSEPRGTGVPTNQRTSGGGTGFGSGNSFVHYIAGQGVDGYGNGGAGGYVNFISSLGVGNGRSEWSGTGTPSFFDRDASTRTNGAAASANTGDGGHGAVSTSTQNTPQNGWAGGSGFARVIYWS